MSAIDHDVVRSFTNEARVQLAKALKVIRHCLVQLDDEQTQWRPQPAMNSIGNLALHLCGNVRQWIIAGVGGDPDVRNRPAEFAARGPFVRDDLLRQLAEVVAQADAVLSAVGSTRLLESRRIQGFDTTPLAAVFDSVAHFKGHTQEIVCLTRMQLGDNYRLEWSPSTSEEGASSSGDT